MRRYQTTAPITLHAGVIGLSKAQAAPRMRSLQERSKGGEFDITGPVQFCAGEVILLDPDHIQVVVHYVLDLDAAAEAEAKAKAEAEAKAKAKAEVEAKAKNTGGKKGKKTGPAGQDGTGDGDGEAGADPAAGE